MPDPVSPVSLIFEAFAVFVWGILGIFSVESQLRTESPKEEEGKDREGGGRIIIISHAEYRSKFREILMNTSSCDEVTLIASPDSTSGNFRQSRRCLLLCKTQ